jgi:hypothetical protein
MDRAAQAGRYGVVEIVSAQEHRSVFGDTKKTKSKLVLSGPSIRTCPQAILTKAI